MFATQLSLKLFNDHNGKYMKLLTLFLVALLSAFLSGCSIAPDEKNESLFVQLCSVDGIVHSAHVQIIREYEGVGSSSYCNNNPQCSPWVAQTVTGEPVALIRVYSLSDAIVVNDLIWPINMDLIKENHWTDWIAPQEQTSDEFYAIKRVNGYKLTSRTVSVMEGVNYRLRFKRNPLNTVDDRLAEIPSCK